MRTPAAPGTSRFLQHRTRWAVATALLLLPAIDSRPASAQAVTIHGCELVYASQCAGADLSGVDLRNGFLARSNLAGANLRNADLTGVNLWKTNLSKADLSQAKMAGTFLAMADLRGADLRGADLQHAFLFRALTDNANFDGANLAGARWVTGAICAPDSIGECHPLPATAGYDVPMPHWQDLKPTPPPNPTGRLTLINDSTITVTRVLPADPSKAQPTDGAAFTGISYVSKYYYSTLHVHVVVPVYAEQDNVAVIAVFAYDRSPPIKLVSLPVAAANRALFDFNFDFKVQGEVDLQFRLGPGQPGAITWNAAPGDMSKLNPATVTITESEAGG
jgi:uncharacterized protein YjbI with pentapeptide repeats